MLLVDFSCPSSIRKQNRLSHSSMQRAKEWERAASPGPTYMSTAQMCMFSCVQAFHGNILTSVGQPTFSRTSARTGLLDRLGRALPPHISRLGQPETQPNSSSRPLHSRFHHRPLRMPPMSEPSRPSLHPSRKHIVGLRRTRA